MNGYRKYLLDNDDNMGWCQHYVLGDIHAIIAGTDLVHLSDDDGDHTNSDAMKEVIAVRLAGKEMRDYMDAGSSIENVIRTEMSLQGFSTGCSDCPCFEFCDACDNPTYWEKYEESIRYRDDNEKHPALDSLFEAMGTPYPSEAQIDEYLKWGNLDATYSNRTGNVILRFCDGDKTLAAVYLDSGEALAADDIRKEDI